MTPATAPPAAVPDPETMVVWVQVQIPINNGCKICRASGLCVCVMAGNITVH